jgi:hypothetical protein
MHAARTQVKRSFCFPGRQKQQVFAAASMDGFTAARETNDASPLTAARETNAIHQATAKTGKRWTTIGAALGSWAVLGMLC